MMTTERSDNLKTAQINVDEDKGNNHAIREELLEERGQSKW